MDYHFVSDEIEEYKNPDYSKLPSKRAMKMVLIVYISLLIGLALYICFLLIYVRG